MSYEDMIDEEKNLIARIDDLYETQSAQVAALAKTTTGIERLEGELEDLWVEIDEQRKLAKRVDR